MSKATEEIAQQIFGMIGSPWQQESRIKPLAKALDEWGIEMAVATAKALRLVERL